MVDVARLKLVGNVCQPTNNFCHKVLGTVWPLLSLARKERNQQAEGVGRHNRIMAFICVLCSLTWSKSCGCFMLIIQTRNDLNEQMIKVVFLSPGDLLNLSSLWSALE